MPQPDAPRIATIACCGIAMSMASRTWSGPPSRRSNHLLTWSSSTAFTARPLGPGRAHRRHHGGVAQAGDDLLQGHVAERLDVAARHQGGAVGIPRHEMLDHRGVVVLDVRPDPLHAEAEGDEAGHLVEEARQGPVQASVPGRGGDREVETPVGLQEEVDLVAHLHRNLAAAGLLEALQMRTVHAAGGAPGREGLELHPEGEDLVDILHGHRADPVAVPRHRADEAFLGQALQRDPAARLPDLEPLHHLGLGEARAGQEAAGDDLAPHQVVGLIALARGVGDGEHRRHRVSRPGPVIARRHGPSLFGR